MLYKNLNNLVSYSSFPFPKESPHREGTNLLHQAVLIGIFPHCQFDLEEVYAPDAERSRKGIITPTQEQQVRLTFHVVAEGELQTVKLTSVGAL